MLAKRPIVSIYTPDCPMILPRSSARSNQPRAEETYRASRRAQAKEVRRRHNNRVEIKPATQAEMAKPSRFMHHDLVRKGNVPGSVRREIARNSSTPATPQSFLSKARRMIAGANT